MSITHRGVQADTDQKTVYLQATCPACGAAQELRLAIVYAPYRFVVPTGPETSLRLAVVARREIDVPGEGVQPDDLAECVRCNAIIARPHYYYVFYAGRPGLVELCPVCYEVLRHFLPSGQVEPEPEF